MFEPYLRVIELPSRATLSDLHFAVLEVTEFEDDYDHLSGFYLASAWHRKKAWLTSTGGWDDDEAERLWQRQLQGLFPLPRNKRLYYLFDFGDSWVFEIRKKGRDKSTMVGAVYPRVVHTKGPQLLQALREDDDDF